MKSYIKHDPWSIIEEGFYKDFNLISESIFSIGNGRFGQRANFEEQYSGESLQGNYIAGVYYPDKTRVGWWKNGYPEYFAKVLNAVNWIGLNIEIDGQILDLNTCPVDQFRRELDMQHGLLHRGFIATLSDGKKVQIKSTRFCSIVNDEVGAIRYSITPLNFSGKLKLISYLDFDVVNQDSNYDEKFWEEGDKQIEDNRAIIASSTRKSNLHIVCGMDCLFSLDGKSLSLQSEEIYKEKYVGIEIQHELPEAQEFTITKYVSITSCQNHAKDDLADAASKNLDYAVSKGFDTLLEEQSEAWEQKWAKSDIVIEGDDAAQQGIRFNIFQLNQTYTGEDPRLNIGPKGFTGEKYGGSTYWDTEAYCFPFYLSTSDEEVSRNLLMYRYKHLDKAIENAEKLGFEGGAALYPMVTINGEECHNEWEITFEEIHRNGAIAYAIYEFTKYTGNKDYLHNYGLEVLIAISRFWAQRVNFSKKQNKYVILGVTGPNEYENNVNNNWHTNNIAVWTLKYTFEALAELKSTDHDQFESVLDKCNLNYTAETEKWKEIAENMYLPYDEELGIYLQQDGFLDKDIVPAEKLPKESRPLVQNWSWDRILRSCYIKQADLLQGMYIFPEQFSLEELQKHYDFYEPITVHESSLSPCVHSILAAKLGMQEKAYEMYLRTARLDIDDYNNDTEDGCHITSMAGSWLSIVKGFGGMNIMNGQLHFSPFVPKQWEAYSFRVRFREQIIGLKISRDHIELNNYSNSPIDVYLYDSKYTIEPEKVETVPAQSI